MSGSTDINHLTSHLFRENSGKMVAVLSRLSGLGNIDLVMDIVQDTFEAALTNWRYAGVPDNPSAWLMKVARNKAINFFKRHDKLLFTESGELFEQQFEQQFDVLLSDTNLADSQLQLLLECCRLPLPPKSRIMITLQVLCGFGIREIAPALLMQEQAVKKALLRAKEELKKTGLNPGRMSNSTIEMHLPFAHTILYLMFNEGYKPARSREIINHDLCYEAIRLARLVANNVPHDNETMALLSLMFFHLSRFPARIGADNTILNLEEQDRSKWDRVMIEEGSHYLGLSTQEESLNRYYIEALIASVHCIAPSFEATDWKTLTYLYTVLETLEPGSPFVRLNRIMAESFCSNPEDALEALDTLEATGELDNNPALPAARASIYKRNGQLADACVNYTSALELATGPYEKDFFRLKIEQCKS